LSDEEIARVRAIAAKTSQEMRRKARIPLPWKPGDTSITVQAARNLVESEKFLAAKKRTWREAFGRRDAGLREIKGALNIEHRAAYEKMLGEPFDVDKFLQEIAPPGGDAAAVYRELGLTGQRADPDFDVKVISPAYVTDHPSVLFDEAHHNFHTSGGRYKVFADLITSDGYRVTANQELFTAARLTNHRVLVIANALGTGGMGQPDAGKSAFTGAECEAIDDWVKAGGSLLLITDHQPFGAAAEQLSMRFGVEMSKGVTADPQNETERGLLFSREKHLLADHAITNGRNESERINRVLTFTGQSLKGPAGSVAFLKFADTAMDHGEGQRTSAAGRAQGVALRHGKGRVVILGEAGQLSAQVFGFPPVQMGMNVPGCDNRQMALNIMHWLSGLTE